MRSYETRKAVLLKTYLASDIKVPILSFMRIDYDVYDLACIHLFLVLWSCSFTLFLCLCSCKRDIYTIQIRIDKTNNNEQHYRTA